MSLTAGSRVGPYEILAPLGAGGMGEVYRARDPKLDREVAIKILPESVSKDADRLARFEREARAASSLNHPNIVTIYDVGRGDSIGWIAMELVSGRSLRELLAAGPLALKKTLSITAQIADGLARAHEMGIVHRDLKPENMMVTGDGLVKILDFGLAKLVEVEHPKDSQMRTVSAGTEAGVLLGTVGYMSPEQACGRSVDFRSDQFALGSVLYEMVAGHRAFSGGSAVETLAAIAKEEPRPLPPSVPEMLRWCVERCLAKEPEDRYASTRDLARDVARLRDHASGLGRVGIAPVGERPRSWRTALPWAMAAFLLAALLASLVLRRRPPTGATSDVLRFSVAVPAGASFHSSEIGTNSAVSPDGRLLVVRASRGGRPSLSVHRLDTFGSTPLAGTEDADSPFWSPDSRLVGFFAGGKLKKVPVDGGPPITLCDALREGTGSWSRDGTILFAEIGSDPGIYAVSADGSGRRRVTRPDPAHPGQIHLWPHVLPDGRGFLFVVLVPGPDGVAHEVRLGELGSERTVAVGPIASRVEYAAGHLLFVGEGSLLAQPFDAAAGRLSGEASPLVDRLHYYHGPANAGFSISQTGVLAYEMGRRSSKLAWRDRGGREASVVVAEGEVEHLRLSPDGMRLAVDVLDRRTGSSDLWVYELQRNMPTRLTLVPSQDDRPVWSPDSRRIAFRSDRRGPPDLYEIDAGSPGSEKTLLAQPGVQQTEDWSPDGRFLMFTESNRKTGGDIWLLPLDGPRQPLVFLQTRFDEGDPRFSPDGRWIAYTSDESGEVEIYLVAREDPSRRTRISTSGGRSPRWRRDGRELFYIAPDDRLIGVPVRLGAALEVGTPIPLFRFESGVLDYDAGPGGERFIAAVPLAGTGDSPLRVIVGWPALLKKAGAAS